ncbi:Uncharacterised protein [Hafnia alvei]|nr:Uncharacterised protein [Hafnia alvei]
MHKDLSSTPSLFFMHYLPQSRHERFARARKKIVIIVPEGTRSLLNRFVALQQLATWKTA